MKFTAASIALLAALTTTACQATGQQQISWECHNTESHNVAICINRSTKIPCTMTAEPNRFHVEAGRAKEIRGYAYLIGSIAEIGAIGDGADYLAHTYNGRDWGSGACYPQGEGAIWR